MAYDVLKGGKESEESKFSADSQINRKPDEVLQELSLMQEHLKCLQSDSYNFNQKMELLIKINGLIIPEFFRQMSNSMPNIDRTRIASSALNAMKDMGQILMKKREVELSEEINLNSPKFQVVFSWLIELFNTVLEKQHLNRIQINNIFNELSSELSGWEDKVSKRLKGLSSKALDEVKNPLINIDGKESKIETEGFKFD